MTTIRLVRVLSVLLAPFIFGLAGCAHRTSQTSTGDVPPADAERKTSIGFESDGDWTYPERNGTWGPACGADPQTYQQSPIDFTTANVMDWTADVTGPLLLINQGLFESHDQNVVFGYDNWTQITIAPTQNANPPFAFAAAFKPTSFHFHQPAEHIVTLDQSGMIEMHIKTLDQFKNVAVFSIMMNSVTPDQADPLLARALPGIMNAIGIPGQSSVDFSGIVDRFGFALFYTYLGSTTTPPCSPSIRWFVLAAPLGVASDDYNALLQALITAGMPQVGEGGNARSTQKVLANTPVFLVTPQTPSANP